MQRGLRIVAVALLLVGCASTPVQFHGPTLIRGTVVAEDFTRWGRDWCGDSRPVPFDQLSGSERCIPHGGELYHAYIIKARVVGGETLSRRLYVAYPGHAIPYGYETTGHFVVQPAPADFASATGLKYMIGDIGGYDSAKNCIEDGGYSHVSRGECKDKEYHRKNSGRCVPLPEYMAHYASGP